MNLASVASVSSLLGQACFSEWGLMASFPGFFSLPLIFCPFRSLSLCFCSLLQAQRPVLHGFRSPDQGLALQQPRCAIRGRVNRREIKQIYNKYKPKKRHLPPPQPFEPEDRFLDFVALLDPLASLATAPGGT